jgi:uncharacterized protein YcfJ
MKKIILSVIAVVLATSLLCACTNRQMGTVGGAALGGAIGYGVTGGSGVGTAVGAVGGGLIGNAVSH